MNFAALLAIQGNSVPFLGTSTAHVMFFCWHTLNGKVLYECDVRLGCRDEAEQ